jgi:hypothetical protein
MRVVFCLFLAACTLWSSSVHSQDSGCGPMPLGSPCATGGLATAGATSPSTNFAAGNPINWLSGNKYLQHTDLPAHAGHPGIELVRHYNSQDTRSGVLGQGWTFSYDTRVVQAGGRWQIVQADGSNIGIRPLRNLAAEFARLALALAQRPDAVVRSSRFASAHEPAPGPYFAHYARWLGAPAPGGKQQRELVAVSLFSTPGGR